MPARNPRQAVPHSSLPGVFVIALTKGFIALVDAEDAPMVSRFNWHARGRKIPYAARAPVAGEREQCLHRVIALAAGMSLEHFIDHINHDSLDCRRENLRPATNSENGMNSRLSTRNSSGIKGVCWDATYRRWMAYIGVGKKDKTIGRYMTKEEAAAAVDVARRALHGQFASGHEGTTP